MEQITLGQIFSIIALFAGVITSSGVILGCIAKISKWTKKKRQSPILEEMANMEKRIMETMKNNDTIINEKIDGLKNDVKTLDVNQCKDVITNYISMLEEHGEVDIIQEERAYEAMDRYTNELHQNSYIHKRWVEVVENRKENIKE